jgi:hypothetical protein
MVKATCTWGDGPDILLTFEDHKIVLHEEPCGGGFVHGTVGNSSTDLNITQAKALVTFLLMAIEQVEYLEQCAEEYDRRVE